MARPLRIELAGGLYHVTSRGDRREAIYRDDEDRGTWLSLLGEVCSRFNWRCHAYCQMGNHFHAVVETPDANLSKGMRQLNGVYTQAFNRRHGLVGHLYQGRFKAILVEQDAYLLELSRYVVLNPVRAGMVGLPGDWPWSSYNAMVGRGGNPDWLETDWVLGQFGSNREVAQSRYIDFVRDGIGLPSIWEGLHGQIFLGSEEFAEDTARKGSSGSGRNLGEVPRAQRRSLSGRLDEYEKRYADRHLAMAKAYLSGGYSMQEVAAHFGVHYVTVSRAVRRYEGGIADKG